MAAHDEARVIRRCLESVAGWTDEVIVVDAASRDGTAQVALEYGARVIAAANELMVGANKNRAIDAASREWVLLLDPDEQVTRELADEIRQATSNRECDGYWLPRRTYFLNRWIRTMGFYPSYQLRLVRNGSGRFPCRAIHEKLAVEGPTGTLSNDLIHLPPHGIAKVVHRQNLYSEHHALARQRDGERFSLARLLLSPLHTFLRRYLQQSGWREGVAGLVISIQAAYSAFLINAKLWERELGEQRPGELVASFDFPPASSAREKLPQDHARAGRDR